MSVIIPIAADADLSNYCRICLQEPHRSQMLDMNAMYDEEAQLTYYDCYELCAKEKLQECDKHEPRTICKHCGVELQWAYDFYKKVQKANEQLRISHKFANAGSNDIESEEDMNREVVFVDHAVDAQQLSEELDSIDDALGEMDPAVSVEPALEQQARESVTDICPRQRHYGQFSCQFCNKLFPNYSHMLKHQQIHETDRPQFDCSSCDRFYLTKQALKVHVDTKHNKAGSVCSICGKVFAIAKGLEIHMRFHNGLFPFECNQCDRKFAQRSHLNVHQQVQHNSARFLCEFPDCGKLFTSSSALRNHECIHSEMPFKCNVCEKGFPARYTLRLHAQRKHNMQLTLEQVESMRKFHVTRSKRVLAQIVMQPEGGSTDEKEI